MSENTPPLRPSIEQIDALRAFNRFYARQIGLLDEHLYGLGWTLTEAHVLFELSGVDSAAASELGGRLGLDAGYLSRILSKLKRAGLLAAAPDPDDKRRTRLALTQDGRAAVAPLIAHARAAISDVLETLTPDRRNRLLWSCAEIQSVLGGAPMAADVQIRAPRPGDYGWIIHRHGALYAEEHDFDMRFEALVAEIVGAFAQKADPACERAWIAEQGGRVIGSVLLARRDARTAQLRLLYVEPDARGAGVGRRLVETCIAFAQNAGYQELRLWTNDILDAALRLYSNLGFELVETTRHAMFGPEMGGQTFRLALAPNGAPTGDQPPSD